MYQDYVYSLTPTYEDETSRHIGVLQHMQTLLEDDATLGDVVQLIKSYQQEFGAQARLEDVIQFLVSRHLEKQMIQRKARTRNNPHRRSLTPVWAHQTPVHLAEQTRETSLVGTL